MRASPKPTGAHRRPQWRVEQVDQHEIAVTSLPTPVALEHVRVIGEHHQIINRNRPRSAGLRPRAVRVRPGLSDREAVERFAFDARWKYAAGGLDFDYPGFVHTVLVDMRARLARSQRPDRIFETTLEAAKAAGLVGRRRVLDSTPLYDAVATMDTSRWCARRSGGC